MRVLALYEKHDTRVVAIEGAGQEALFTVALKVLREREAEGYWYDNWDDGDPANQWADRAEAIANAGDGKRAWAFLNEREDFEYEGLEVKETS